MRKKARLHFGMFHKDSHKTYQVIINNKVDTPLIIEPPIPGKYRDGAKPPRVEHIKENQPDSKDQKYTRKVKEEAVRKTTKTKSQRKMQRRSFRQKTPRIKGKGRNAKKKEAKCQAEAKCLSKNA